MREKKERKKNIERVFTRFSFSPFSPSLFIPFTYSSQICLFNNFVLPHHSFSIFASSSFHLPITSSKYFLTISLLHPISTLFSFFCLIISHSPLGPYLLFHISFASTMYSLCHLLIIFPPHLHSSTPNPFITDTHFYHEFRM